MSVAERKTESHQAAAGLRALSQEEIERAVQDLRLLGYTKLEAMLPPATLAEVRALLAEHRAQLSGAAYPGYSERRAGDEQLFNLQSKDRRYLDLLGDPGLEAVMMPLLNDPYYPAIPADRPNYILGEYIARASGARLRLHIDCWMPAPGPNTWMMQLAVALDDRDEENGCSLVVPGSHLSGSYTERDYEGALPVPMKAGDVALWDSRLWHGANANRGGKQAWALIATLQRWWVKPRFDITGSLPPEIYGALSDSQKALLGFCSMPPADERQETDTRQGYGMLPKALGPKSLR